MALHDPETSLGFQSALLGAVEQAIIATDLEGTIQFWNRFAERLYGWPTDEALGRHIREVIPSDTSASQAAEILAALQAGQSWSGEFHVRRRDGASFFAQVTNSPIHDAAGMLIGIVGISRDITERKRLENQLRRREQQLAEAQRIAHIGSWEWDLATNAQVWSDELYRIFGLEPSQYPGSFDAFLERVHPDDRELVRHVVSQARLDHQPYRFVVRIVCPDDTVRTVHVQGQMIMVGDEAGARMIGAVQDVTEQQAAEAALRASEERFRLLFEHSPDAIWLLDPHDPDFPIVDCNEVACQTHGYSKEELLGQSNRMIVVAADDPERSGTGFVEHLLRDGIVQGEDMHRRKDGQTLHVEYSTRLVTIDGRELALGIDRDITARKQMEAALRSSEERFRVLFEHSPDAIWLLDVDASTGSWLIVDCNEAACSMHGYTRAELLGQPIAMFAVEPDDPERLRQDREGIKLFWQQGVLQSEDRHRRRDGAIIDIEYAARPVTIMGRQLALGVDRDVTARKQMEAALRTYQEQLRQLSHRLVQTQEADRRSLARELHDQVGQSLTAVKMNLQAVRRSSDQDIRGRSLDEAMHIIDDALEKVRDLAIELRPSLLDDLGLASALHWYVDRESRRAGLLGLVFVDADLDRIPFDLETTCFRIVQEALTNVVRHARARTVEVEVTRQQDELSLMIRDDGFGFPEHTAATVARPNLGLLSMRERAELAGGRLKIESTPGRGARIHACFPLVVAAKPRE